MRYQILLAEDDEISQEIVQAFLAEETDLELTVVSDGKRALEVALTTRFDLLILDQNLPSISGDRILRHLRAGNTKNSETPILRLSASYRDASSSQTAGAPLSFLPKPISAEALISTIRSFLPRI